MPEGKKHALLYPAKFKFSWVYWNLPVCPLLCLCVCLFTKCQYFCVLLLCFNCVKTLHMYMHELYIEGLQVGVLNCQLLLVEELSPLKR